MLARITARPVRWSQDRAEALVAGIHAPPAGPRRRGRPRRRRQGGRLPGRDRVRRRQPGPLLLGGGALARHRRLAVGRLRPRRRRVRPALRGDDDRAGRRVPGLRPAPGPPEHRAGARPGRREAAGSTRSRCGAATCCPTPRGRGSPATGARIDVGPLGDHLDELVDAFDLPGWRRRQDAARADGRLVGIGVSTLVQGTAPTQYGVAGRFGSFETASVAVLPDGHVTVAVGTKSQGQAHETVLAQVAATALGTDPANVTVRDGDTDAVALRHGHVGQPVGRDGRWRRPAGGRAGAPVGRRRGRLPPGQPTLADVASAVLVAPARAAPRPPRRAWRRPRSTRPGGTKPLPDEHGHTDFDETSAAFT